MTAVVVAHDAGGAEVISSWVRKNGGIGCQFVLEGPAQAIFARKCGPLVSADRAALDALVASAPFVLCGSGWGSDLEKLGVRAARAAGVRSAVYLDHWNDYRERFDLDGDVALPDELWVGDEYGVAIARRAFPSVPVRLEPNLYLDEMVREVAERSRGAGERADARVLYLTEPIVETVDRYGTNLFGYTELEALEGFLRHVDAMPGLEMIRVRPHPAEPSGKYDDLAARATGRPVEVSPGNTLPEDIAWADWVVGLDSMAMVVALLAGKRVSTAIPHGGRPPVIPYPQIERLFL